MWGNLFHIIVVINVLSKYNTFIKDDCRLYSHLCLYLNQCLLGSHNIGEDSMNAVLFIFLFVLFPLFVFMFTIVTCTIEFALKIRSSRSDNYLLYLWVLWCLNVSLYHFSLHSLSCILFFNCIQSLLHWHCCQNKTFGTSNLFWSLFLK